MRYIEINNKEDYLDFLIDLLHKEFNDNIESWAEGIFDITVIPWYEWNEELGIEHGYMLSVEQLREKMKTMLDSDLGILDADWPILFVYNVKQHIEQTGDYIARRTRIHR